MKKLIVPLLLTVIGTAAIADDKCTVSPRIVQYKGEPVDVSVNPNGRTRLVLPEASLIGIDPEVQEGIAIEQIDSELANRVSIRPMDDDYNSLVFVYGASGKEYVLNLVAGDCSDSQVTVENFEASPETLEAKRLLDERDTKTLNSYMFKYIQSGRTMPLPTGYRKEILSGNGSELVMEVGSIKFYAEETWRGSKKDGIFIRVENHGRQAQKIDISQIDFDQREIIQVFGMVDTIAMMPISHVLAPAPQYTTDLYDNQPSVGYLLIASEK